MSTANGREAGSPAQTEQFLSYRTSRRGLLAGGLAVVAGASVPAPAFSLDARARAYPRLSYPDARLWHLDTRPTVEGFASGPNGRIYYRTYGRRDRTPVLVLHGGPAGGELYMRPYAGLSSDRQVVTYDQSGCGRSESPKDLSRYTLSRYVEEVEAVRSHLGFEKVVLVGHSWGSFLAPAYTSAFPHRVSALVLAGGARRWQDYAVAAEHWLKEMGPAAVATVRHAEASGRTDSPAYGRLLGEYYARHLCRLTPMPPWVIKAGEIEGSNPVYKYLNGPSEFQFTGAFADIDVTAQLRSITSPILVTCGEYDEAPAFIGKGVVEVAKDARLHIFPGLSHCSHIEDPVRVMAATSAFLRDHA